MQTGSGAGNWTFDQADFRLLCHFMEARRSALQEAGPASDSVNPQRARQCRRFSAEIEEDRYEYR